MMNILTNSLLNPSEKLLLLYLTETAENGISDRTLLEMEEKISLAAATITRNAKSLEKKGYLELIKREKGKSTLYKIL